MHELIAVFLTTFLFIAAADAAVYKWVDEKGITQYSDTPPPGKKPPTVDMAPAPPKEETEKALQKKRQFLEEERLKTEQQRQNEVAEARKKQEDAKAKRDAGACVRTLISLCDGKYKSREFVYLCTDLNKYYRIENCSEPVDSVIGKTQEMFRACEKDYGDKCIQSKDRQPTEGVECLARHRTDLSSQCLNQIESLFRHVAKE
jgi:hypothetical protein